jgi:hypothetical protein
MELAIRPLAVEIQRSYNRLLAVPKGSTSSSAKLSYAAAELAEVSGVTQLQPPLRIQTPCAKFPLDDLCLHR